MTDQTPRMPDLWWDPKYGLLELDGGIVWILQSNRESLRRRLGQQNPSFNPPLPADAVKLGDVEELQNRLDWILNSVRRALVWGRDSETEALEDTRRHAEGKTR